MHTGTLLSTSQEQRAKLSLEARQGVALLGMNALELRDYLENEVGRNIFLEYDGWAEHAPADAARLKDLSMERLVYTPSAFERLERRIGEELPEGPERDIALFLAGCLDERGYLAISCEEAAGVMGVGLCQVEDALRSLQGLAGPGVAARSLSECLSLQISGSGADDDLARRIAADHLEALARGDAASLARALGVSEERVDAAFARIRALDPFPGACLGGETAAGAYPELVFELREGKVEVRLADDLLPPLRVNADYACLFEQGAFSEDAAAALHEQLRQARSLMQNIAYRRQTVFAVAVAIAARQAAYFAEGTAGLRPLSMTEVAREVGVSASTVSRIANNVYAQTPQGVLPLRRLFKQGGVSFASPNALGAGAACATVGDAQVKAELRSLVAAEDRRQPFSDGQLSALLEARGYRIARRTVGKYRTEMGIPPRSKRVAR